MVIRKMNTVLVKHNKILFGAFSIIIIISFVWFFTPGIDGSLLFGNRMSPNSVVGKVFGKKVKLKDYQKAVDNKSLLLSLYNPAAPAELRDYVIANIFTDIALDAAAENAGITVPDEDVIAEIKRIPVFNSEKGFDHERYEAFIKSYVEPFGLTTADFEESIRKFIATRKLLQGVSLNVIVVPDELDQFMNHRLEKIKASAIRFPFASYKPGKISEQELEDFYKKNTQLFMTAPQLMTEVVRFDYKNYMKDVKVTDKQVEDYYKASEDKFKKDGKVQPLAAVKAQIVGELKLEEAKSKAMDAAREFRNELYNAASEVSTGAGQIEVFNTIAGKHGFQLVKPVSWLTASSELIDKIGREPALVAALFHTTERYPITKSVAGKRAAYVAVAVKRQPSVPAPFAEVKAKVEEMLALQRARAAAKEAASNFAAKLAASKNPQAELAAAAKNPGIQIKPIKEFSRQTVNPADYEARYALMATDNITPVVPMADGMMMILIEKRTPPTAAEKQALKDTLTSEFQAEKRALAETAFLDWVRANTESYLSNEPQQQ